MNSEEAQSVNHTQIENSENFVWITFQMPMSFRGNQRNWIKYTEVGIANLQVEKLPAAMIFIYLFLFFKQYTSTTVRETRNYLGYSSIHVMKIFVK